MNNSLLKMSTSMIPFPRINAFTINTNLYSNDKYLDGEYDIEN